MTTLDKTLLFLKVALPFLVLFVFASLVGNLVAGELTTPNLTVVICDIDRTAVGKEVTCLTSPTTVEIKQL